MAAANIVFVHKFLSSLVFTDAVETIVLILLVRYVLRNHTLKLQQMLFAGLYASFSTISYVWFVFPFITDWSASTEIIFAEAFAFIVEALFYRWVLKLDWKVVFFLSFVCNLVSYLLGPVLRAHGLWIYW
jgi:hypothetical protein